MKVGEDAWAVVIEQVAKAIDPEAWNAIEDGRDKITGNMWGMRRQFAKQKADRAINVYLDHKLKKFTTTNATPEVLTSWLKEAASGGVSAGGMRRLCFEAATMLEKMTWRTPA